MRRQTGIKIGVSIAVILLSGGLTLAYFFFTRSSNEPQTTTPDTSTAKPAQTPEQLNTQAEEAYMSALKAMNEGDKKEATKQLDIAMKSFKEAKNQDGIDKVDAQLLIVNAIPEKPAASTVQLQ